MVLLGVPRGRNISFFPDFLPFPETLDMYLEKVNVKNTVLASPAPNVDLNFSGALGPWALGPWAPEAAGRRPTLGPRALGPGHAVGN